VADWLYSTFHGYVDVGLYPKDWAGKVLDLQAGEPEQSLAAEGAALFRPTAEVVLRELERVLRHQFDVPNLTIAAIIDLLKNYEVIPKPADPPKLAIRDPDDVWVLASALAGKADVLVTGDQDLLSLRDQADIRTVDPRGFWDLIKVA